jgi:DNA adenine methylase
MDKVIKRPIGRYHGGKFLLAPWIISQIPPHRIYTESFGGFASVLLRKPRSYAEIYNDLDGEVGNIFRVLRNPTQARELIRLITLTPYSRDEFELSYILADDPIEQARRTLFRFAAGYSTAGANANGWKTGFRGNVTCSGTTPVQDWRNFPQVLDSIVDRLRGVVIENRPAVDVIQQYDAPNALHYVDPPYPFSTRNVRWAGNCYHHEMTDDNHRELAGVLRQIEGMVILSGYACELYDAELYPDWRRIDRKTHADGAKDRLESLWLSPRTVEALHVNLAGLPLFQLNEAANV